MTSGRQGERSAITWDQAKSAEPPQALSRREDSRKPIEPVREPVASRVRVTATGMSIILRRAQIIHD